MRIAGKDFKQAVIDVVPIFRGDDVTYIKVQALNIKNEFEELCLRPEPPVKVNKKGERITDIEDKEYKKKLEEYSTHMVEFMIIKSLAINEDLQWEIVKMGDPSTWCMWRDELLDSGLLEAEVNKIQMAIFTVNSLNDDRVEEARKSFLAELRERQKEQN